MTDNIMQMLSRRFTLTKQDAGEFARMKVKGMRFTLHAYEAAGLGHVSVMTATGFLGLMKMDTVIVNPTQIDLPLFSYDRIQAAGNDTLIMELYDTLLTGYDPAPLQAVAARYAALPDRDSGAHWYDGIRLAPAVSKKGKKITPALDEMTAAFWEAYLALPAEQVTDPAAKQAKARAYVDGLLRQGGPSTDVFKKEMGEQTTAALFRKVLFATE